MSRDPVNVMLDELRPIDPAAHARLVATIEAIVAHEPIPCHVEGCTHTAAANDTAGLIAHVEAAHPLDGAP